MQTVLFTPTFERQIERSRLSQDELMDIVSTVAADPLRGDLMPGTGGARKMRHAGRGFGKSGGYRTIYYFGGEDVPIFMLALINKGERADLSRAEKNALAATLPRIADAYRAGRGR